MLVYYFCSIVIFGNFAKVLTSSDESKYIDLLPEEEKEEFLQKIAKRIFEDVESAEGHKKDSGEIPDKQLEEHDAFVKKIYEEESQNLRRLRGDEAGGNRMNNNNEGKEENDNHVNENTKVIGLEKKNDRKDIDFTVRATNTNYSHEVLQESDAYTVNVQVKYDEPITEKVFDSGTTLKDVNKSEDTVEKDIQVRNIRREGTEENNDGSLETVTDENNMHKATDINNFDPEVFDESENNSNFTNTDNLESGNVTNNNNVTNIIKTIDVTEVTTAGENILTAEITNITELIKISTDATNITDIEEIASDELETTLKNNYGVTEPIYESEQENENSTNSYEPDSTTDYPENVTLASDKTEKPVNLSVSAADANISRKHSDGSSEVVNEANVKQNDSIKNYKVPGHKLYKNQAVNESRSKPISAQIVTIISDNYLPKSKVKKEINKDIQFDTRAEKDLVNIKENGKKSVNIATVNNTQEINNNDKHNSYDDKRNARNNGDFNILNNTISIVESKKNKNDPKIPENIISVTKGNILRLNRYTPNPTIKTNNKNKVINQNKIKTTSIDGENDFSAHSLVNSLRDLLMKNYEDVVKVEKEFNRQSINSETNKLPYQSMKGKPFHVYEISPNQSPFLRSKRNQPSNKVNTNKDEAYYVPIYNYSPDNAYYNPKNRQGPNSGEDDRKETKYDTIDKNEKSDNIDRDFGFFGAGVWKSTNKLREPIVKMSINKLVNLVKRPTMLRNSNDDNEKGKIFKKVNNIFPDSSEAEHPLTGYNEDDESLKSNIRAIRKILYKQQNFGYIPLVNSTESKARYKEIEDLGKETEILNMRTVTKQPITVKRYKNVGFIITGKGKKKLYLPFDDIHKYDINTFKFDDQVYKASDIARHNHNIFEKTRNQQNILKDILEYKQPNTIDAISNRTQGTENKGHGTYVYVEVLGDMIRTHDEALVQYDWLGSTVDIQAGLDKLLGLTMNLRNGENIHNSDLELLKYVLNLFKSIKEETKVEKSTLLRSVLPRNNKRLKHNLLKKKGLLERAWLYKRTLQNIGDFYNKLRDEIVLDDFENFLKRLEDSLYDLHTAIKHVASITKYKKQKWYEDLKDLYLKGKKEYLEVVLHLSTSRLLSLIEESAQNGLEEDHKEYIKNNEEAYRNTKREFEFVLKILEEIKFGKYFGLVFIFFIYFMFSIFFSLTTDSPRLLAIVP
ncbi:hypothetical protein K1T71_014291 [Dendrolimus kikuchii]|uniref:Uncharacterized protein n=1 Tax=Dendrolimus kikuchii TaxID=765133 RepID=A0ACC1CFK4_9NEOP|nr:hypothetical protein K1T71_014291 [Dendrolimus kikuchii]